MDAPLIEARGLSSFGPTPILRGVNLKIGAGASALIIGSNGAGKSTLLRILSGLSAPTIGSGGRLRGRWLRGKANMGFDVSIGPMLYAIMKFGGNCKNHMFMIDIMFMIDLSEMINRTSMV
jgi:energy-coupling factor transporter ATP-binding protein EcfA2